MIFVRKCLLPRLATRRGFRGIWSSLPPKRFKFSLDKQFLVDSIKFIQKRSFSGWCLFGLCVVYGGFERWRITCFVDVTLLRKFGIQFINGYEHGSFYSKMWYPSQIIFIFFFFIKTGLNVSVQSQTTRVFPCSRAL